MSQPQPTPNVNLTLLTTHANPSVYLSQFLAPHSPTARRVASFALIKQILARWQQNLDRFSDEQPAARALLEVWVLSEGEGETAVGRIDAVGGGSSVESGVIGGGDGNCNIHDGDANENSTATVEEYETLEIFTRLCSLIECTNKSYNTITAAAQQANRTLRKIRACDRLVAAGTSDEETSPTLKEANPDNNEPSAMSKTVEQTNEPTWSSFPACIPQSMRSSRTHMHTTSSLFGKAKLLDWLAVSSVTNPKKAITFLRKQFMVEDGNLKKKRVVIVKLREGAGMKKEAEEVDYIEGRMDRCPSKKALGECVQYFTHLGRKSRKGGRGSGSGSGGGSGEEEEVDDRDDDSDGDDSNNGSNDDDEDDDTNNNDRSAESARTTGTHTNSQNDTRTTRQHPTASGQAQTNHNPTSPRKCKRKKKHSTRNARKKRRVNRQGDGEDEDSAGGGGGGGGGGGNEDDVQKCRQDFAVVVEVERDVSCARGEKGSVRGDDEGSNGADDGVVHGQDGVGGLREADQPDDILPQSPLNGLASGQGQRHNRVQYIEPTTTTDGANGGTGVSQDNQVAEQHDDAELRASLNGDNSELQRLLDGLPAAASGWLDQGRACNDQTTRNGQQQAGFGQRRGQEAQQRNENEDELRSSPDGLPAASSGLLDERGVGDRLERQAGNEQLEQQQQPENAGFEQRRDEQRQNEQRQNEQQQNEQRQNEQRQNEQRQNEQRQNEQRQAGQRNGNEQRQPGHEQRTGHSRMTELDGCAGNGQQQSKNEQHQCHTPTPTDVTPQSSSILHNPHSDIPNNINNNTAFTASSPSLSKETARLSYNSNLNTTVSQQNIVNHDNSDAEDGDGEHVWSTPPTSQFLDHRSVNAAGLRIRDDDDSHGVGGEFDFMFGAAAVGGSDSGDELRTGLRDGFILAGSGGEGDSDGGGVCPSGFGLVSGEDGMDNDGEGDSDEDQGDEEEKDDEVMPRLGEYSGGDELDEQESPTLAASQRERAGLASTNVRTRTSNRPPKQRDDIVDSDVDGMFLDPDLNIDLYQDSDLDLASGVEFDPNRGCGRNLPPDSSVDEDRLDTRSRRIGIFGELHEVDSAPRPSRRREYDGKIKMYQPISTPPQSSFLGKNKMEPKISQICQQSHEQRHHKKHFPKHNPAMGVKQQQKRPITIYDSTRGYCVIVESSSLSIAGEQGKGRAMDFVQALMMGKRVIVRVIDDDDEDFDVCKCQKQKQKQKRQNRPFIPETQDQTQTRTRNHPLTPHTRSASQNQSNTSQSQPRMQPFTPQSQAQPQLLAPHFHHQYSTPSSQDYLVTPQPQDQPITPQIQSQAQTQVRNQTHNQQQQTRIPQQKQRQIRRYDSDQYSHATTILTLVVCTPQFTFIPNLHHIQLAHTSYFKEQTPLPTSRAIPLPFVTPASIPAVAAAAATRNIDINDDEERSAYINSTSLSQHTHLDESSPYHQGQERQQTPREQNEDHARNEEHGKSQSRKEQNPIQEQNPHQDQQQRGTKRKLEHENTTEDEGEYDTAAAKAATGERNRNSLPPQIIDAFRTTVALIAAKVEAHQQQPQSQHQEQHPQPTKLISTSKPKPPSTSKPKFKSKLTNTQTSGMGVDEATDLDINANVHTQADHGHDKMSDGRHNDEVCHDEQIEVDTEVEVEKHLWRMMAMESECLVRTLQGVVS